MDKNIEERAKELYGKLPIIQDDCIATIEEALKEQKAIDEEQLPLIKETYYNAGYEIGVSKTIDKACKAFCKMTCEGYNECGRCYADGVCESYQEFKKTLED